MAIRQQHITLLILTFLLIAAGSDGFVTTTMHVLTDLVGALRHCITMYKVMNASVAGAVADLRVGCTDVAWPKLKDAMYMPNIYGMALTQGKTNKDPLWEENYGNQLLAGMANGIIELIAKKKAR